MSTKLSAGPWMPDYVSTDGSVQGWICCAANGRVEPVCHIEACGWQDAQLLTAAWEGLAAAECAYLAFLEPPYDARRARNQRALCLLRDFIAKATGRSSEDVQNDFESRALAKAGL
jgi:hypothetical protein